MSVKLRMCSHVSAQYVAVERARCALDVKFHTSAMVQRYTHATSSPTFMLQNMHATRANLDFSAGAEHQSALDAGFDIPLSRP